MSNKTNFVEELKGFVLGPLGNPMQIKDMHYIKIDSEEWVYVEFASYSQKRFCVTCDSNQAILGDFVRFCNNFDDYGWLMEDEIV